MSSVAGEAPVSRRRVFYIPGYDPIHPRRYRELYRKEGAAQADISGYDLTLSPRKGGGRFGWHVTGTIQPNGSSDTAGGGIQWGWKRYTWVSTNTPACCSGADNSK